MQTKQKVSVLRLKRSSVDGALASMKPASALLHFLISFNRQPCLLLLVSQSGISKWKWKETDLQKENITTPSAYTVIYQKII